MYNFIEGIKKKYFSLVTIYEIIFNISAIFLTSILLNILIKFYYIQSDFFLFIILMMSIFGYCLIARICFRFPSSLMDEIKLKSYNFDTVKSRATNVVPIYSELSENAFRNLERIKDIVNRDSIEKDKKELLLTLDEIKRLKKYQDKHAKK